MSAAVEIKDVTVVRPFAGCDADGLDSVEVDALGLRSLRRSRHQAAEAREPPPRRRDRFPRAGLALNEPTQREADELGAQTQSRLPLSCMRRRSESSQRLAQLQVPRLSDQLL